jgi:hypothetical protein
MLLLFSYTVTQGIARGYLATRWSIWLGILNLYPITPRFTPPFSLSYLIMYWVLIELGGSNR